VQPHGTVRVAPDFRGSEYEAYDDRQICRPADAGHVPMCEALIARNALSAWLNGAASHEGSRLWTLNLGVV
jgi:putative restriction endonuclease